MLIIAGLRYEHNEVNYDAFDVKRTGTTVVATPIQGGNSYGYLLPSLHLKYSQNSLMNYRFAYTQSYAKPNFVDIVPFVNYDADAIRLFLGNPDLKPSLSNNLDLMVEKYNRTGGILSAGFISNVLGTQLPGPGTIYMGQELRFVKPVYVGDTVTATVTATQKIPEKNRLILDTVVTNQRGEKVITGTATVMPPKG